MASLAGRLAPADGRTLGMLGWALARLQVSDAAVLQGALPPASCPAAAIFPWLFQGEGGRTGGPLMPLRDAIPLAPTPGDARSLFQTKQQQNLAELARAAERAADAMPPAALRQLLWAAARLPLHDWQMVAALARAAARRADEMDAGTLSTVLWALASLQHYDAELCDAATAAAAAGRLRGARPQHLAAACWALARLRHPAPALFAAAAAEARARASELEARHVAQLAWAFAARRAQDAPLFEALAARAAALGAAQRLEPQHVSVLAHSFAKQGHRDDALMRVLGGEGARLAPEFSAQNLSNAAWGFAQLGARHPALFGAVAAEAKRRRLEGFNTQNLSDLAWALAAVEHEVCCCYCCCALSVSSLLWPGQPVCFLDAARRRPIKQQKLRMPKTHRKRDQTKINSGPGALRPDRRQDGRGHRQRVAPQPRRHRLGVCGRAPPRARAVCGADRRRGGARGALLDRHARRLAVGVRRRRPPRRRVPARRRGAPRAPRAPARRRRRGAGQGRVGAARAGLPRRRARGGARGGGARRGGGALDVWRWCRWQQRAIRIAFWCEKKA